MLIGHPQRRPSTAPTWRTRTGRASDAAEQPTVSTVENAFGAVARTDDGNGRQDALRGAGGAKRPHPTSGRESSGDLYLPEARAGPALLSYYPYQKDDVIGGAWEIARGSFTRRGYASLLVDFRGTGGSGGDFPENFDTARGARDGAEAVEWAAAQDWCSGSVGVYGISYGGIMALAIASQRPPHLKAIAPMYGRSGRAARVDRARRLPETASGTTRARRSCSRSTSRRRCIRTPRAVARGLAGAAPRLRAAALHVPRPEHTTATTTTGGPRHPARPDRASRLSLSGAGATSSRRRCRTRSPRTRAQAAPDRDRGCTWPPTKSRYARGSIGSSRSTLLDLLAPAARRTASWTSRR